jgi:hypothetical protein
MILELLGEIKSQTANLNPRQSLAIEIVDAIEAAHDALSLQTKEPSFLSQALKTVRDVCTRALTNEAASMLGEKLPLLIQQLEHFLKLRS